jgi:hypothetical protein
MHQQDMHFAGAVKSAMFNHAVAGACWSATLLHSLHSGPMRSSRPAGASPHGLHAVIDVYLTVYVYGVRHTLLGRAAQILEGASGTWLRVLC